MKLSLLCHVYKLCTAPLSAWRHTHPTFFSGGSFSDKSRGFETSASRGYNIWHQPRHQHSLFCVLCDCHMSVDAQCDVLNDYRGL